MINIVSPIQGYIGLKFILQSFVGLGSKYKSVFGLGDYPKDPSYTKKFYYVAQNNNITVYRFYGNILPFTILEVKILPFSGLWDPFPL